MPTGMYRVFRRSGLFKRMIGTLGSGPRAKSAWLPGLEWDHTSTKVGKPWENDHIEAKRKVVFWSVHVVPFTEESLS